MKGRLGRKDDGEKKEWCKAGERYGIREAGRSKKRQRDDIKHGGMVEDHGGIKRRGRMKVKGRNNSKGRAEPSGNE